MLTNSSYSVVPVYNARTSLGTLMTRLDKIMAGLGGEYEVILILEAEQRASS